MELKAALDSPNPLTYECALPVHQDGTCNRLQHYAVLGGDARGAKQVNLDITDRPSGVYTYVANMVEKRMREDLELCSHNLTCLAAHPIPSLRLLPVAVPCCMVLSLKVNILEHILVHFIYSH